MVRAMLGGDTRIGAARASRAIAALVALASTTCATVDEQEDDREPAFGRSQQALTSEQARVLGFETPTADWSSNTGTLGASSDASDGTAALTVIPGGWTEINSIPLSTLANVRDTLSYDIYLPQLPEWGETRAILVSPTLGQWWTELGRQELNQLPGGQYSTVSFPLSSSLVTALSGAYSDLTIKLVINAQVLSQPYRIDHLVMTNEGDPPPPAPAEEETFTVLVPSGVSVQDTFVSATDHVSILSQAHAGVTGATPAIANFGPFTTYLQAEAQAFANIFSAGPVQLDVKTRVEGAVTTEGTIGKQGVGTNDAPVVTGGEFPQTDVDSELISWSVEWPSPVGPNIQLDAAPTQTPVNTTLAPGAYGDFDVHSRNHVFLSGGTYFFDTFNTEPEAQLHLDTSSGAIVVYVKQNLPWGGGIGSKAPVFTDDGDEAQLLLAFLGTGDVFVQGSWQGTIVAPDALIKLERPSNPGLSGEAPSHRGAFFGKGIEIAAGQHTVLHVPFAGEFPPDTDEPEVPCSLGDTDNDGTLDCTDVCRFNAEKITPGVCGCSNADEDVDGDGIPTCLESPDCETNAALSVPGQCGGCSIPLLPVGSPCTDSPCGMGAGSSLDSCDGAGTCGDPTACEPEANGCFVRRALDSIYWFCSGPAGRTTAQENCQAVPGRQLATINTLRENELLASIIASESFVGANDLTMAGSWRWSTPSGDEGLLFWTGGANGARASSELFEAWSTGQPSASGDCATLLPSGEWLAQDCGAARGYVCEQPLPSAPPFVPVVGCPPGLPDWACGPVPGESAECVPAEVALPLDTEGTYEQIDRCAASFANGDCTEADPSGCDCVGAAAPPPVGSTCPPLSGGELGFCELQDLLGEDAAGNACDPEEDCCEWSPLLDDEALDFASGPQGLTYVDDAFRSTTAPGFASGVRVTSGGNPGEALQVTLGGVNNTTINNMSGGWLLSFTLAEEALVGLELDYNLTQAAGYEADESSQVLVSVDGVLQSYISDTVDELTGDGNGGPVLTTGFKFFRRNLGVLAAGAHQIMLGAFNNKKTAADEVTTLLLDNVRLRASISDCPGGYVCGRVNPSDCTLCGTVEEGPCVEQCPPTVLRCGKPMDSVVDGHRISCGDDAFFANDRCSVTELCADPGASGNSNPFEDPRSDLEAGTLNPSDVFGTPVPGEPSYVPDPPCSNPPCVATEEHRWCHYNVNVWDDPALAAEGLQDPTPAKPVAPDTKKGTSGNDLVSFTFDPGVTLDFDANPAPFGEATFNLNSSASFDASVDFTLPPAGTRNVSIIDVTLGMTASRCAVSAAESHVLIFGQDFLPRGRLPTWTDTNFTDGCNNAVASYLEAFNRAKKAYRDTLELIRQYDERLAGNGAAFPEDFCESIVADVPRFFPAHPCNGESAAATINRFVDFYHGAIERTRNALAFLQQFGVSGGPKPFRITTERETQTVFQATFPLGPIPMLLEVEAFMEYGLNSELNYELTPSSLLGTEEDAQLALATVNAQPFAAAGTSLFVGAGFGVNGFSVSAGVEGTVTLGRVSSNNWAGAGIGVRAVQDDRDFPPDIAAAASPGAAESKTTLFPGGPASAYEFSLLYKYGSDVMLTDIMKGTVAGRVRLKVAFFSKTWRRVLFTFPGFSAEPIELLRGGDSAALSDTLGQPWGSVQMPLPFVQLARLDETEVLAGAPAPIELDNVAEFFFDGLCECIADHDPNESCFRDAECCGAPSSICFTDPVSGGGNLCLACRSADETCNDSGDCCSPDALCHDEDDAQPPGIKVCSCVAEGGRCNTVDNCCTSQFCEVDPDGEAGVEVCRCRGLGEDCTETADCCGLTNDVVECDPDLNRCRLAPDAR